MDAPQKDLAELCGKALFIILILMYDLVLNK